MKKLTREFTIAIIVVLLVFPFPLFAAAPGALRGSEIGPDETMKVIMANPTAYAMGTTNTAIDLRFVAKQNLDVYGVRLDWASAGTPAAVTLNIETNQVSANQNMASGTLYDANATISITPSAGVQTYTFASNPTTKLTAGSIYHVFLITTGSGTQSLNGYVTAQNWPYINNPGQALTAANGTTRTNLAEVSESIPICSLVLSDGSEEIAGFSPYYSAYAFQTVAGANWAGMQLTTLAPMTIAGIAVEMVGTHANVTSPVVLSIQGVSGASSTIDNYSLASTSNVHRLCGYVPAPVSLPAGTYYITMSSPSYGGASLSAEGAYFLNSASVANNFRACTSANSGSTWSVSGTLNAAMWLILDSVPAPVGGGGAF